MAGGGGLAFKRKRYIKDGCAETHKSEVHGMYFGPKFQILNPRKRFLL